MSDLLRTEAQLVPLRLQMRPNDGIEAVEETILQGQERGIELRGPSAGDQRQRERQRQERDGDLFNSLIHVSMAERIAV
jgi:hypothetical protein